MELVQDVAAMTFDQSALAKNFFLCSLPHVISPAPYGSVAMHSMHSYANLSESSESSQTTQL